MVSKKISIFVIFLSLLISYLSHAEENNLTPEEYLKVNFSDYFPGDLTIEDKELLSGIRKDVQEKSLDPTLREESSKRNKDQKEALKPGYWLHGIRGFKIEILSSILDNGVVCSEFVKGFEDGETFYHADFFENVDLDLANFQKKLSEAKRTFPLSRFAEMKNFLPNSGSRKSIAIIVRPDGYAADYPKRQSRVGEVNSKFIVSFPIKKLKDQPNQVSFLGGIPSTEITAIVIGAKISLEDIKCELEKRKMYIPIFDIEGSQLH